MFLQINKCIIHAEGYTGMFELCNGSNNNAIPTLTKIQINEKSNR